MRKDRLCPSPAECPEVLNRDPHANAQSAVPCEGCPSQKLAEYLASPFGQRLSVVVDLDYALNLKFQMTLRDVSYLEFCLLKVFHEEREKYVVEEQERRAKGGR